ncbi:AMP-binding protein [Gordonia sp. SL306]|uniref:AMP-binding protein n=1 Tax=Gordonia sp. SL306 TaxID=2995145 RepID=UPI00227020E4|nr:AMP-binding protein [Gordonia sp. SL306]WAC57922.1 AMP-binding protein [Gordonia sp. SL306]
MDTHHLRSLGAMLRYWADVAAEQPAIGVVDGRSHTFGSWFRRSSRIGCGLDDLGIGSGDTVGFLGKDAVVWGEVLVAASCVRAAGVPLNWRLSRREMSETVADAAPSVIVVEPEFLPLLGQNDPGDGVTRVIVGEAAPIAYDTWVDGLRASEPEMAPESDDVAMIVYTSGTSGRAKGVELPNRAIAANIASSAPWDIKPGDTVMIPAPLFHVSGTGWLFYCLGIGAEALYTTDIKPSTVLDVLAGGGVDHALTVPAVVHMLISHPDAQGREYPNLRTLIYGGSPMAPATARDAMAIFGCDLVQSYGMTETCGPITFLTPEDHRAGGARLAAAGRAVSGVELVVADPIDGAVCPPGVTGEVRTRSTLIMNGYRNRPDELVKVLTPDGWFRTGDAGYLDEDGYLFLCDRIKDMIVSGGENIYPIEVENVLLEHPQVLEAAVIGVPDEKWGETVKAVVVAREPLDPGELTLFCRDRLAHYKCPTSIDLSDELPRNPSGKILKRELRKVYWSQHSRSIA